MAGVEEGMRKAPRQDDRPGAQVHPQSQNEAILCVLRFLRARSWQLVQRLGGAGYPNGPDTWDDLYNGAQTIRQKTGHPCGLGLSQERDTSMAMRTLLWSFGGAVQDDDEEFTAWVIPTMFCQGSARAGDS